MNKKSKVILAALLAVIAITIGLFVKSSLQIDQQYMKVEDVILTEMQQHLTQTFSEATTEAELVESLKDIHSKYTSEIILMEQDRTVYSTFSHVQIENIRDVFDDNAIMYKSQGLILFQDKEYRLMYAIYHADAKVFVQYEFQQLFIFIVIIFVLFLILSLLIMYLLYSPLFKINNAILKMEDLDFKKAMQITGEDAVTQEFAKFVEHLNDKIVDDSRKYTKLELVLLFEKQRLDFAMNLSQGALHELKTPIYQLLLQTEEQQENCENNENANVQALDRMLHRINTLQQNLHQNVESLTDVKSYFDVVVLYRTLEAEFYYLLDKHDITIDFVANEYLFVELNEMALQLILHNLLSNIAKYSIVGSDVEFEIYFEQQELIIRTQNMTSSEHAQRIEQEQNTNIPEDPYSSGVGKQLIQAIIAYFAGTMVVTVNGNIIEFEIKIPLQEAVEVKN